MASGGLLASGVVTGGHLLTKTGAGTLTLSNGSDSFASLTVSSGSVLLGSAASVTNTLTINSGPVETTSTSTLSNALAFNGGTLAAASGTTLTATGSINVEGNTQSFGVAGQTGTIVLDVASNAFFINFGTHVLTVNGGTLQQAAGTTALLGLASFPHSSPRLPPGCHRRVLAQLRRHGRLRRELRSDPVLRLHLGHGEKITGFNANEFTVDSSGFANRQGSSSFFVAEAGNSLDLNFTPVPGPATWLGGALVGWHGRDDLAPPLPPGSARLLTRVSALPGFSQDADHLAAFSAGKGTAG